MEADPGAAAAVGGGENDEIVELRNFDEQRVLLLNMVDEQQAELQNLPDEQQTHTIYEEVKENSDENFPFWPKEDSDCRNEELLKKMNFNELGEILINTRKLFLKNPFNMDLH